MQLLPYRSNHCSVISYHESWYYHQFQSQTLNIQQLKCIQVQSTHNKAKACLFIYAIAKKRRCSFTRPTFPIRYDQITACWDLFYCTSLKLFTKSKQNYYFKACQKTRTSCFKANNFGSGQQAFETENPHQKTKPNDAK